MRILLIGNFAPPYEEENLHNISLSRKLKEDGHECTVINISQTPSEDSSFINASSNIRYFFTLLRHILRKDVIHFLTKGYLRVGLLKLMLAIFAGTLLKTKKILTIHSEFFSILGQMRSPFGGTQTLYTSFFLADKILFTDKDTYNVAKIYRKKSNFELVPSFIYLPEDIEQFNTTRTEKMNTMRNVVFFANVKHPSFLFDILSEVISKHSLFDETGIVIVFTDKPSLKLQHAMEDTSGPFKDRLVFIEYDDVQSALKILSKAHIILKPMSCDGTTFFERFAMCAKKAVRSGRYIYFPGGLVFVKEGSAVNLCADIIDTLIKVQSDSARVSHMEDPYEKIIKIYEEKE